ncbi:MAG: DMT family transporter [Verrucomicrobia bacterium]|nr:DMT family transporter [Verrucomicrobiota bacterium]
MKLGFIYVLAACFLYSVISCFSFSLEDRYSVPQIILFQESVALLALLALPSMREVSLKTKHISTHLVRDLAALTAGFFWLMSLKSLHLVNASILQFTSPFYVPFLAWFWFKEPIPRKIWWGIGFGFLGVYTILQPNFEIFKIEAFWGVLAGVASALGLTAVRHLNLKGEPVDRTMFYLFLVSAIVSLPFALNRWVTPNWTDLGSFLLLGLSSLANNLLLTRAFRYAPVSILAPLTYSAVFFNGCLGWIFFGEKITTPTLIGCILIILGASLIYLLKESPQKPAVT